MAQRGRPRIGTADGRPRLELADATIPGAEVATAEAQTESAQLTAEEQAILDRVVSAPPGQAQPDAFRLETEEGEEQPAPTGRTYYGKRKAKKEAEQSAVYLVMILEGAAIVAFGDTARMLEFERKMIVDPLTRMMMRANPAVTEAIEKWTDPIILLFGFVTWGTRLYAMSQEGRDDQPGPPRGRPPADDETPPKPQNGRTVRDVLQEDASILRAGPDQRITSQVGGSRMIE